MSPRYWNEPRADHWRRWFCFPPTFWIAVLVPSLFTIATLRGRLGFLGEGKDTTLKWDIFLAWIPVWVGLIAFQLSAAKGRNWLLAGVLVVWLLFFPNAPYLLTQFVHLDLDFGENNRLRPTAWNNYLRITSVCVIGMLLTLTSVRLVEIAIARRLGKVTAGLAVAAFMLLAGFGVALGRFARLNSWDPFTRPYATAKEIVTLIGDVEYQRTTGVLAMLLFCTYVAARQVAASSRPDRIRPPTSSQKTID